MKSLFLWEQGPCVKDIRHAVVLSMLIKFLAILRLWVFGLGCGFRRSFGHHVVFPSKIDTYKSTAMRLRIRHGSTTERLQVEDNATYGDIKGLLSSTLGVTPEDVKLSLNKSVRLCT